MVNDYQKINELSFSFLFVDKIDDIELRRQTEQTESYRRMFAAGVKEITEKIHYRAEDFDQTALTQFREACENILKELDDRKTCKL